MVRSVLNSSFLIRLVSYYYLCEVIARVVFEIGFRWREIELSQTRQYLFYGFLLLEYIYFLIRGGFSIFRPTTISRMVIPLIAMCVHGIVIGLSWGNGPVRIGIDTINILVVILNLMIISSPVSRPVGEWKNLVRVNISFLVIMLLTSLIAVAVNSGSKIGLGSSQSSAVAISIAFADIFTLFQRKGPKISKLLTYIITILPTAVSWNRTTLLVFVFANLLYGARNFLRRPFMVLYGLIVLFFVVVAAINVLPQDSGLMQRINGLENLDLDSRTGSIGERQAEWDAIREKIDDLGPIGRFFGGGHGATYDVQYTWQIKQGYSNAHFSWALFYLRYGNLGYVYLLVWLVALIVAALRFFQSKNPFLLFIFFTAIWNIAYLGTYAYFSFFIAGIPFFGMAIVKNTYQVVPSLGQKSKARQRKNFGLSASSES